MKTKTFDVDVFGAECDSSRTFIWLNVTTDNNAKHKAMVRIDNNGVDHIRSSKQNYTEFQSDMIRYRAQQALPVMRASAEKWKAEHNVEPGCAATFNLNANASIRLVTMDYPEFGDQFLGFPTSASGV